MTCHTIYWQKAWTKSKDIGGSDRHTGGFVCQRFKRGPNVNFYVRRENITWDTQVQWTLVLRPAWLTNNLGYDQKILVLTYDQSLATRMPVKDTWVTTVGARSNHHHHHISVMQLGHVLTRSGLTCPKASSKVCHDSFCQSHSTVSLSWVVYY
jgi:hypothetical protein